MPTKWNSDPSVAAAVVAPVITTRTAAVSLLRYMCLIAVSLLILNWRYSLLVLLPSPWIRIVLQVACWATPVVLGGKAMDTASRWLSTRQAAKTQDSVTGTRRKLYGLPPPQPRSEPLRQRRPFSLNAPGAVAGAGQQPTPITPPQRYAVSSSATGIMGTPYSTASTTPALGGGMLRTPSGVSSDPLDRGYMRTPMSDPYRRSGQPPGLSPGGAVIASPEQLSVYFDNLAGPQTAAQQGEGTPGLHSTTPAPAAAYTVASENEQSAAGVLPVGVCAPYYRMTWLPKKAAAVAAADTPTLTPSAPEEVEDFVVSVLNARHEWLELWTERLREWLAERVLKPLVAAVGTAHEPVNVLLQQFNHSTRLPPLPDILADVRSAGSGDVDGALRSLQAALTQHVTLQPAAAMTPKAKELLAAVNRYADLLAVMRGKRPADILPPSNTGYLWLRLQQLADSTCLKDFCWNGGSAYGGRPWSADQLPNDSALLLYLFTAYLDAPGWQFTAPPNAQAEGGAQPLYLGTLGAGARSTAACSAILTYRPERHGREVDALLALQLPSPNPLFCYLAAGRLIVLANYQYVAVFYSILFFLQYHKIRYNGTIGRQHMDDPDLALDTVVQPPPVGAVVSLGAKRLRGLGWFW